MTGTNALLSEKTIQDVFLAAQHVGIPVETVERFVGTLAACGYHIKPVSEKLPPDHAITVADLVEARRHIARLVGIVSATPSEAFKGWAMGEFEPYEVAKRATDWMNKPKNVFAVPQT